MYNLTNITAAKNIFETFTAINHLSDKLLASMFMLVLFLIIFIMFIQYDKKYVLLGDSFIMSIIGILFFVMGLVNWVIAFAPLLLLFVSILIIFINKEG